MICHKHKCIFIHIAKCAGTSVENAFGYQINTPGALEAHLGWDEDLKLYRQHATPQQLIDLGLISLDQWNTYYKFVIYRNSWAKLLSDYLWTSRQHRINDSFENYLNKTGGYYSILNNNYNSHYCGDHLYLQKDYFFLNGEPIEYNTVIDFDNIKIGFSQVIKDLNLGSSFFNKKENTTAYNSKHYSYFYTLKTKGLVHKLYKKDIEYFKFKFKNKTGLPLMINSFRK